jgi:hypothetical protein
VGEVEGAYIVQFADLLLDDGVDAALDLLRLVRSLHTSKDNILKHMQTDIERKREGERERYRDRERL